MNQHPFSSKATHQDGRVILAMEGEINSFAEQALKAAYSEAELSNPGVVILDFSRVTYINSTGIALIVGLLTRARKANRRMLAIGLSDHYTEIFRITRLSDYVDMYPDISSALAAVG